MLVSQMLIETADSNISNVVIVQGKLQGQSVDHCIKTLCLNTIGTEHLTPIWGVLYFDI